MEIQGRLITKLPEQSGTSAKGEWKKQDAVIETLEQYPKKVCITFWSDKVDELKKVNDGETIKVYFDIESREYQGKWYTNIKAWKFELSEKSNLQNNNSEPITQPVAEEFENLNNSDNSIDDLPF
ncbi:MAG: DUF3127 domain-containing protein [Bacteroidetes bacterium]|nr:DUF3127 domain-containing protein [Bacteroidota bacterium]